MFVMTAVLLFIGVALLVRVRPNIHNLPAEPEGGLSPRQSEDRTGIERAGEGSDAQFRSRSRSRDDAYDDARMQLATTLSITED
jgi:hypothetical protein